MKDKQAYAVASLWIILIITNSETESLEVNGVTIGFNKTCSSHPNITCFVYYIKQSGCSDKAATAFPHLYRVPEDNRFPEKPASMETQVFSREYPGNGKYYTGLRVTLMGPVTGSFDVVKGFELIFTYNRDEKYGCLIFDLSAQNLTYNDVVQTGFWTEIWPMAHADPPIVFLVSGSLPPAPAQFDRHLNVTENVQNGEYGVCVPNGGCGSDVIPPSQWVTTIFYKTTTNSSGPFNNLEMSFALGPPEYKFNEYTVSLENVNDSKPIIIRNMPKEKPHHVFTRLSPGQYVIKIKPYDEHSNDRNRCLCRNEFQACLACTTTVTNEITVGYTQMCPDGTYGAECKSVCSEGCLSVCDKKNGTCEKCREGYTGAFCIDAHALQRRITSMVEVAGITTSVACFSILFALVLKRERLAAM